MVEDENFHLKLQFRFYPDHTPKHHIHLDGLKNPRTREPAGNLQTDMFVQVE